MPRALSGRFETGLRCCLRRPCLAYPLLALRPTSVSKVSECQRQVGHLFLEQGNGRLEVVSLPTSDPNGVALDRGLDLEFPVFQDFHDPLCIITSDAMPNGDQLLYFVT